MTSLEKAKKISTFSTLNWRSILLPLFDNKTASLNHIFILHLLEPVVKAEESIPTEAVVEEVVAKADEPKVEVVEEVVAKPEEPIVEAKAEGTH